MTQATLTTTRTGMPMDEFIRRYETEGPFELVEGERIPMPPVMLGHVDIAGRLYATILNYALPKQLGKVFMEGPFVTADVEDADWVKGARVPDVMYIVAERFDAYQEKNPDWRHGPLRIAPDVAVEVVSANDRYTDIAAKVEGYLADGVRLVWIVDPWRRRVTVHERGSSQQTTLTEADTLVGGEVLPGFEIRVGAIFGE